MVSNFVINPNSSTWLVWDVCLIGLLSFLVVCILALIVSREHNQRWVFWKLRKYLKGGAGEMVLTLQRKNQSDVFIELGGGSNPVVQPRCLGGPDVNVDIRACYLPDGRQAVDFVINFEEFPWPIGDNDFDGLVSQFCLEHVSYQNVPQFLSECLRILKPGGRCAIVTANTEAQLRFIQGHPAGWDDKDDFHSFSEVLFGTQDYQANAHRSYFSPPILVKLLTQAGFQEVTVRPYGARGTDLLAEGVKSGSMEERTESNPLVKSINEQFVGSGKEPFGTTLKLSTEEELRAEIARQQEQGG